MLDAPAPNMLWVSDFTYVAPWTGFVYVAPVDRRLEAVQLTQTIWFYLRPLNVRQHIEIHPKRESYAHQRENPHST